ncbi:hypothetical protein [Streptomyces mirabilis]|uniref:hypothetical protein n=1 Tax=Streptomyces mirabilis TaxID=68239 RepID=UPI0031BB9D17
MRDLRRRIGSAPVRALFDALAGLRVQPTTPRVRFGPTTGGETSYAGRLLHLLRPDMLVLWDKGFDSNAFLSVVTDAQVLGQLRSSRRTPVLSRLADDSYLSVIGTVKVRVIDAQIAVTCANGTSFTGSYRLVTTLTDARRHPATALVGLYHQRREHDRRTTRSATRS